MTVEPSQPGDPRLNGIEGWLILVAISVILAPIGPAIRIVIEVKREGGPILPVALLVAFGLYQIVLIGFFFAKKRAFPGLKIASLVVSFVIVAFTYYLRSERGDSPSLLFLIGAAASTIIWSSYLVVSKRVEATFCR